MIFKDYEFLGSYTQEVKCADHEVFMSFTNDDDAIAFRNWFATIGNKQFLKWLDKTKSRHNKD